MPILGVTASSISGHLFTDTGVMFPLGMVQVGSAGASTVSFSSIPDTYTHLQIRYLARASRTATEGGTMRVRFNSETGNNYSYHILYGDGSNANAYALSSTNGMRSFSVCSSSSSNTLINGAGVIDILDYKDTNKYKTLRHLGGYDRTGLGEINLTSGLYQFTTAISSIEITLVDATNYTTDSSFALYGIKGA